MQLGTFGFAFPSRVIVLMFSFYDIGSHMIFKCNFKLMSRIKFFKG